MTFLELTRTADLVKVRVNMDHVSSYFPSNEGKRTTIVHHDSSVLIVMEEVIHIDAKIHQIEAWRRG